MPLSDLQPVYIAVAVKGLTALGLKFGHITLIQSLLVCLGVQRVAVAAVRTAAGASERAAHLTGLITLLLLLSPVTPLAWYAVYFGSDGWLQTALLWTAAVWLDSHRRFPDAGPAERAVRAAGLTALAGASVLVRPNAGGGASRRPPIGWPDGGGGSPRAAAGGMIPERRDTARRTR